MAANRPPHVQRNPVMVIAGIVLVLAGALTSVGIYSHLGQTQEVIVIVSPVARGEQIHRADLMTAHVGFDPLLTPVPSSHLNQIVGQYATSDLVPGTFLTKDSVGERVSPVVGQAEIGVALMAGQYPDDGLLPGDRVLLVAVPERSDLTTAPLGYTGVLVSLSAPQGNTMITATVLVGAADAPQLAALSASNRLALVLASRER